jgi:hypothetical protein
MSPFLISFKKICREKNVSLLNLFLFILPIHLGISLILEFVEVKSFNLKKAFHRIRVKKLLFLKIDLSMKCFFSLS